MTTPNTESLLRGFRMTPGANMQPPFRQTEDGRYERIRAAPSGPPALTRYNGDGTWKVVRAGETLASNFDSEPEAAQWIADNA